MNKKIIMELQKINKTEFKNNKSKYFSTVGNVNQIKIKCVPMMIICLDSKIWNPSLQRLSSESFKVIGILNVIDGK